MPAKRISISETPLFDDQDDINGALIPAVIPGAEGAEPRIGHVAAVAVAAKEINSEVNIARPQFI